MKIFYSNLADSALIIPLTENLDFPAINIQNFIPSKIYKTLATQTAESITFDLGSAGTVTSFIAYNTNFDGTETGLAIQGNSTNNFTSPGINETLTAGKVISKQFTGGSYRYWRLVWTKANSFDVKSMGRVYLGDYLTGNDITPDFDGYSLVSNDLSIVGKSLGGQSYLEKKSKFRTLALSFTNKSNATKTSLDTAFQTAGTSIPLFLKVSDLTPLDEVLYMRITNNQTYKNSGWNGTTEPTWNLALNFEELI